MNTTPKILIALLVTGTAFSASAFAQNRGGAQVAPGSVQQVRPAFDPSSGRTMQSPRPVQIGRPQVLPERPHVRPDRPHDPQDRIEAARKKAARIKAAREDAAQGDQPNPRRRHGGG